MPVDTSSAKGGRAAAGGASSTRRRGERIERMTVCPWLISWAGPSSSRTQIHLGACQTNIFAIHWPQMWRGRMSMQCRVRRIKSLGREQSQPSSALRLTFTPSHQPCRTISNPVPVRTSNVEFRVGHSVNSSKREYPCFCHLHNINRSNLQCMKQQLSIHGKLGKWK